MRSGWPALGVVLLFSCGPNFKTDGGTGGWQGGGAAGGGIGGIGGGGGGGDGGLSTVAMGPSHSSSVTESDPGALLAVNPLFDALVSIDIIGSQLALPKTTLPAGSRASSVAVSADRSLVYLALRGSGQLLRLPRPLAAGAVGQHVSVGSEPVAVALSPTGRFSVVALAGEAAAVVVDNASGEVHRVALPGPSRAVAITNDGDHDDTNEHAYVTVFFALPGTEGSDTGRHAVVAKLSLSNFTVEKLITLSPIADTGLGPTLADGGMGAHVACFPNQLTSILIVGARAYVANICASPQPPLQAFTSAFSALSVIDLSTDTELTGDEGSTTLARIAQQADPVIHSLFSNPVDLVKLGDRLFVVSQGADRLAAISDAPGAPLAMDFAQSVSLADPMCGYQGCGPPGFDDGGLQDGDPNAGTTPGSCGACDGCCQGNICIPPEQSSVVACGLGGVLCETCNAMIDSCIAGFCAPSGAAPMGVPFGAASTGGVLVVNDLTGLSLTLAVSPLSGLVNRPYAAPGHAGAPGHQLLLGTRFFDTAVDRWSSDDALSCATCHPDGRSDSVTWVFGAGPRQTVPLDGTFAKGDPADHRVQNWTGVADEIYDVESLVRSTMKGLGALTTGVPEAPISLTGGMSIDARPVTRNDGLNGSSKLVSDELSQVKDWAQLERFVEQLHTPVAPSQLDAMAVARGRALFASAGCTSCHAGPKWTASRVPYVPSPEKNGSAVGDNGLPSTPTGLRTVPRAMSLPGLNFDTLEVAPESLPNPDGGANLLVGPERITCVLRAVGTFDAASPLERKADGTRAQGALGFNVPSLLGLATSAPYFHHGAAAGLSDVFAPQFAAHYQAGNVSFVPNADQVSDLVVFLESIDESTAAFPVAMAMDVCGVY